MRLFGPRANTIARVGLAALLATPVALVAFALIWARTPYYRNQSIPIAQPVQFDHRHHAADDGIDCRYCHDLVTRSATAGIPPTERCMGCHNQIWSESPLLEPVRQSYIQDQPIPWRRVHRLPDFVFFDHSIHVGKGIGCVSCHGRVDRMAAVWQEAPLEMGWCLACHRNPVPHLRPRDQITNMDWQPPVEGRGEFLRGLARDYDVHPRTDCTTCHR